MSPGEVAPDNRSADDAEPTRAPVDLLVDVSGDRRARVLWVVFLAGPVIWLAHFMLVYLVVEAGCTGDGPGLELLDPPVSHAVTIVATAAGALACLASARWAYRRWRSPSPVARAASRTELSRGLEENVRSLAFAGFVLAMLSFVAIVFVGLPALFLPGCR